MKEYIVKYALNKQVEEEEAPAESEQSESSFEEGTCSLSDDSMLDENDELRFY